MKIKDVEPGSLFVVITSNVSFIFNGRTLSVNISLEFKRISQSPLFKMKEDGPYHLMGKILEKNRFSCNDKPDEIDSEVEVQLLTV